MAKFGLWCKFPSIIVCDVMTQESRACIMMITQSTFKNSLQWLFLNLFKFPKSFSGKEFGELEQHSFSLESDITFKKNHWVWIILREFFKFSNAKMLFLKIKICNLTLSYHKSNLDMRVPITIQYFKSLLKG